MSLAPHELEAVGPKPERIVAIGGGTGLPVVLRGLRRIVPGRTSAEMTAVVTMSDDGGSSGRLRRTMSMPPPGDVRNCLVALAEEESLLAGLFQHRYNRSDELGGHSVGNLILAALAEQTGCFLKAVEMSSRVLRTVGRILPATQEDIRLKAVLDDGSSVIGETKVGSVDQRIRRISLVPEEVRPAPGVVEAILAADLVVIGPGSLFTSILPNIVVPGIAEALHRTNAAVVVVANLVTQPGETARMDLADHLQVIEDHAGGRIVDGLLANSDPIDEVVLERYRAEGASPLSWTRAYRNGILVEQRSLLAPVPKLRHDPEATANGLVALWSALRRAAFPATRGRGRRSGNAASRS